MVPWSILCEHGLALLLVWATVGLAGCALLPFARLHIGFVGAPLLGVVFWTVALYLFPFRGGLDVAAGLIVVIAITAAALGWRTRSWTPIWKRFSWSTLIIVVGSLPYITTLLYHYVPFGMDGSMHMTAATLIARSHGLPESYAPFAPDVAFPPMNLGLSTVAAVAIRWGGDPAAVLLACHHLTFTLLIVATYLLLRRWIARTPAAVLAVVSVWTARASQASLEWGGFPTVLSVAIGVFAARLLLQQGRGPSWRLSAATGAAIAAIPLIHGVGAGTWLYCVGPWITLATLLKARSKLSTLRGLAITGIATVVLLFVYRSAGTIDVQADEMDGTRAWQESSTSLDDGWRAWLSAWDFVRKDSGSFIVLAGFAAGGVLALRRQWGTAFLLAAAWISLATVVANSRWWILPASFLLYPERAIYWAAPISAVSLALAWRALPISNQGSRQNTLPLFSLFALRSSYFAFILSSEKQSAKSEERRAKKIFAGVCAVCLLLISAYYQNQFYQKIVREEFINNDGWEALVWARQHLRPERDFVQAAYNSAGSFLPAVAQVGCTGAHHHHFIGRQVRQAYQRRVFTHVLLDRARAAGETMPPGRVVFSNRTITIVQLADGPLSDGSQNRAGR